ncbi:uncharacterized protein EAF01_011828 [Botrytis porri]|uniref:uncharacterized protein n=1 Tax=Botrytis porri TaxID=87229 RepID=UPI001901273B|nr:uncharacterized protein EAF01_011828 [Botrytis porri]KAF7882048.1 hypothetical protein EAF01_011828 [Botrytis porri]
MASRTVHVRMWIYGVETRKEGLSGKMGEGLEIGEKGEGKCARRCEKICEKMGEKIDYIALGRTQRTALNNLKAEKSPTHEGRQADQDNCLRGSVQWEYIWDPWLGKEAFSGSSLRVDDFWRDG